MAVAKKKEEMYLCDGHGSEILKCTGMKRESDFYNVWSVFKGNGKSHYCKDCVAKIFDYYLSLGSLQSAMYYTCQLIDVPFIAEIYEKINQKAIDDNKSGKKSMNYFGNYVSELQKYTTKKEIWNNFSCTDVNLSDIDSRIKTREVKQKEIECFELDWGKQESIEDYTFLEYRFDVYTDGKELKAAEETLYRQLCLVELAKRRKEQKKELTKEEQDMIIKLMDKLKISDFDNQKDKSDIEKILERQIWEIENTEPCEVVDKEEYKDYLDIGKNWGQHILRSMKNILSGNREYPDITKDVWN